MTDRGDRTPEERDIVTEELVRYGALTDARPSAGFVDRVMAAVEAEPAPARRGAFGLIAASLRLLGGPARQTLRMAALTAVVVLAVGGALVGAELSGLLRQGPPFGSSGSPVASPVVSSSSAPTRPPTPTPTVVPTPPETPEPTDSPTAPETSTSASRSPQASESEDAGSGTPRPSSTQNASSSPGSSPGDT